MNHNIKGSRNSEDIDFQTIAQYIVRVARKWWVVAICSVLCASIGFVIAKVTYVPSYTSTMKFVIDNKSEATSPDGQSSSDIAAGIYLARNYVYLMTETNGLMDLIAKDCGYTVDGPVLTGADIKKMVSSKLVENTAIIDIGITSPNPEVSYAVALSYVDNYSKITDKAYQSTRAILIDEPVKAIEPNEDNTPLIYTILGFCLGAGLAIFAICFIIFLKDTVKLPEDITNKLGQKIIGSIVRLKNPGDESTHLITDKKTGFMFIESFKIIRTKIENMSKRYGYKAFVVTSALANEGKTTIAINMALALAKTGKSVLLIDADLRKPSVYKGIGISAADDLGLPGVLQGKKTLNDSIKYFEKYNLFLLVTSQSIVEPAELLSSDEMDAVMEVIKNEFDYVIIDTPPASLVADASVFAQYADANVMVVRRDHASMRRIRRTIDDMTATGKEVVGCIYNDAEKNPDSGIVRRLRSSKLGYGDGYGYGYGYEYSDK